MNSPYFRFIMRLARAFHMRWNRLKRPVTLGVKAAIWDAEGRVLLVKHSYTAGWHLPGGGVGRDETLTAAVRREVREELGVELIEPLPRHGVYFAPHQGKSDHIILFRAIGFEGEINTNWEIDEAAFFYPRDVPPDTTEATKRRLAEMQGARAIEERW